MNQAGDIYLQVACFGEHFFSSVMFVVIIGWVVFIADFSWIFLFYVSARGWTNTTLIMVFFSL